MTRTRTPYLLEIPIDHDGRRASASRRRLPAMTRYIFNGAFDLVAARDAGIVDEVINERLLPTARRELARDEIKRRIGRAASFASYALMTAYRRGSFDRREIIYNLAALDATHCKAEEDKLQFADIAASIYDALTKPPR